ncbi:MAG: hypothetical protein GY928_18725 [Colwellia sp.]|nr:hypothetical protein [Colwellia sp.]
MAVTVKEKIVRKSLRVIEKQIVTIDYILSANPLSKICDGRNAAHEILVKHKGDYPTIAKLIEPLAREEKQLFALAKKQQDSVKLIEDKVRLESEKVSLSNELYMIERKKM